ncbi:MAG: hypothetical protein ACUVWR_16280 [Anaerolineae bacterium]
MRSTYLYVVMRAPGIAYCFGCNWQGPAEYKAQSPAPCGKCDWVWETTGDTPRLLAVYRRSDHALCHCGKPAAWVSIIEDAPGTKLVAVLLCDDCYATTGWGEAGKNVFPIDKETWLVEFCPCRSWR